MVNQSNGNVSRIEFLPTMVSILLDLADMGLQNELASNHFESDGCDIISDRVYFLKLNLNIYQATVIISY